MPCRKNREKGRGSISVAMTGRAGGAAILAGAGELETIREHGAVFINQAGGHTWGIKTVQFCRRKQLVFPHFKREEIRIKQFRGGRHWYAYIGDVQLRDGDCLKWNTREAAQAAAEAIVAE